MNAYIHSSAEFSPCRSYRYALRRVWQPCRPLVLFIGLNPSTADASMDDPTVRRCATFAQAWGFGGLLIGNLFAYRSSDPSVLARLPDPIGLENDAWLTCLAVEVSLSVAAWGNRGRLHDRSRAVSKLLGELSCLGLTRQGQPRHPLYTRADTMLKVLRLQ